MASAQRSERQPHKPVNDSDKIVVRNKIHEFYTPRHQLQTLTNLLTVLRGQINYPGSRWHLHQTLLRLGFVEQRQRFYSKRKELEDQGYNCVFVDET